MNISALEDRLSLDGKVALVTGGGSGIGRATARLLAHRGAFAVIADINAEGGEDSARIIREDGGRARFVRTDVRSEDDVRTLMHTCRDQDGLDVIVNFAGMLRSGPIEDFDIDDWDAILAVNLRSCFLTAKHGAALLRTRGGGAIVTVASDAALKGFPGVACYSASKGAIISLTRALAAELGPDGTRVNCLCPGWVDTPFNDPAIAMMGGRAKVEEFVRTTTMLGRQSSPDEMAHNVLYLVTSASAYMTAHVLVVDGGFN